MSYSNLETIDKNRASQILDKVKDANKDAIYPIRIDRNTVIYVKKRYYTPEHIAQIKQAIAKGSQFSPKEFNITL